MDKFKCALDNFCFAFGAKIKWGKFDAIWSTKVAKGLGMGLNVRLIWIMQGGRC